MGIRGTQLYGPTIESWSDSFKSCLWVLFWYLWCSRHSAGTVSPSPLPIWGWRCLQGSGGDSAGLSSRSHTAGASGWALCLWQVEKDNLREQTGKERAARQKRGGRKAIVSTGRHILIIAFQLKLLHCI